MILRNAIKTPDGTILESVHRHDFVSHTDKNGKYYFVDGGLDYLRRSIHLEDLPEDLTIMDNGTHELRRKYLKWGNNYDKDMNLLSETIWKPIKDLSTDHIEAILAGNYTQNEVYVETFKKELEYRKENNL